MNDDYSDIIDLPHPISQRHPQMPLLNRAAQFAPFSALSGYEDAIMETARTTDDKAELTEDNLTQLNEKLLLLRSFLRQKPRITILYFQPDAKKAGGAYLSATGIVKKIDDFSHTLILEDGTTIFMDRIIEIEGEIFSFLDL